MDVVLAEGAQVEELVDGGGFQGQLRQTWVIRQCLSTNTLMILV